jgi:hypothetical protein
MQRGKETYKANFNKLWSKIPKEKDEFGTRKTMTTTTTTIIRVTLNKKTLRMWV